MQRRSFKKEIEKARSCSSCSSTFERSCLRIIDQLSVELDRNTTTYVTAELIRTEIPCIKGPPACSILRIRVSSFSSSHFTKFLGRKTCSKKRESCFISQCNIHFQTLAFTLKKPFSNMHIHKNSRIPRI